MNNLHIASRIITSRGVMAAVDVVITITALVEMLERMFVKVIEVGKSSPAHRTHVGFVVFVHDHVAFDVARLREAAETYGTRVWFYIAVG